MKIYQTNIYIGEYIVQTKFGYISKVHIPLARGSF